jgi:hypothetical protein
MARTDAALARNLDYGEVAANGATSVVSGGSMLRLAFATRLTGPGKYRVLEARRRRAQINARRLLDLMEAQERGDGRASHVKPTR